MSFAMGTPISILIAGAVFWWESYKGRSFAPTYLHPFCLLHVRTCTLVGCYHLWWHTMEGNIMDHQHANFGIDSSRRSIMWIFLVEVPWSAFNATGGRPVRPTRPPPQKARTLLSSHKVLWFWVKAFDRQAREIRFWEVPCSACHMHRAPRKSTKEVLCTLKIECEWPTPFSR